MQTYCKSTVLIQYGATKNLQITLIILGNGTHVFFYKGFSQISKNKE